MGERNKYQVVIEITTDGDDEEYVMDHLIDDVLVGVHQGGSMDGTWNATVKKIRKEK